MKPGSASTAFAIFGLPETEMQHPALTAQDQRYTELLRRQTLEMEAAASRSKLKTRRLLELCGKVTQGVRKSDAWLAKHEKFFRSPVWKLVSDEAIRTAHFKCEYLGCARLAKHVDLLEFPEEHLDLNADWMKRDNILIALCDHHHEIMHGFVMKRIVPLNRQSESPVAICPPSP